MTNAQGIHWNENVAILTKFPSLTALEVVILTTSSASSDDDFIKILNYFRFRVAGSSPSLQWRHIDAMASQVTGHTIEG